jgi:hypothetical protein
MLFFNGKDPCVLLEGHAGVFANLRFRFLLSTGAVFVQTSSSQGLLSLPCQNPIITQPSLKSQSQLAVKAR